MVFGSKTGFLLGVTGGVFNLLVMFALISKIVLFALNSMSSNNTPDYYTYFIFIGFMLYFGILGVWTFSAAYKLKYPFSVRKSAVVCLVIGLLSLNVFTLFAGLFGLADSSG